MGRFDSGSAIEVNQCLARLTLCLVCQRVGNVSGRLRWIQADCHFVIDHRTLQFEYAKKEIAAIYVGYVFVDLIVR